MKQKIIAFLAAVFAAALGAAAQKAVVPPAMDFTLILIEDDTALCIAQYTGHNESIEIPANIQGFPVKEVCRLSNGYVKNLVIPEGVEKIWELECEKLTSVSLPSTLTVIGEESFRENRYLTSVTLPKNLKAVGRGAFSSCRSLASIKFPDGLEVIGPGAFSGCEKLTSVTVPQSVRVIEGGAFSSYSSSAGLTQINIPDDYKIYFGDPDEGPCSAYDVFEGEQIDRNLALKMKLKKMEGTLSQEEARAIVKKYHIPKIYYY